MFTPTCEHHLHGLRLPNGPDQPLCTPGPWDDPQVDLRLTEESLLSSIDDVTHHGHLTTAPQGETIDSRDHRLTCLL